LAKKLGFTKVSLEKLAVAQKIRDFKFKSESAYIPSGIYRKPPKFTKNIFK
jgi:hypothetical protein